MINLIYCAKCGHEEHSNINEKEKAKVNYRFMDSFGFGMIISAIDCPACQYKLCCNVLCRENDDIPYQKERIEAYTSPDANKRYYTNEEDMNIILSRINGNSK